MFAETRNGFVSSSYLKSHSKAATSLSFNQFGIEPKVIFSNEIRQSKNTIERLQEFIALTRSTNSQVLQVG